MAKTPVEEKKSPEPKIIPEVLTLSPAVLAFKQILENKPELASKTLKDGSAPNREIVEFLLNAAGLVLKNDVLDSKEASQALELVGKAQEKLRKQAALNLENLHFCKDIHGFGSFDPLTSSHGFQQGKGNLPGEKSNFMSKSKMCIAARITRFTNPCFPAISRFMTVRAS